MHPRLLYWKGFLYREELRLTGVKSLDNMPHPLFSYLPSWYTPSSSKEREGWQWSSHSDKKKVVLIGVVVLLAGRLCVVEAATDQRGLDKLQKRCGP